MAHGAATATLAPPLALGLRLRLSGMMFFQFAIWGAWAVVFNGYLTLLGYSNSQAGAIGSLMALGGILSPMVFGFLADRFMPSERLMAILHLAGGATLLALAQIKGGQFWVLFALMLVYALLYNPTLSLANSICFAHVPDGGRDFPGIRVIGTIGWMVGGYLIDALFAGKVAKWSVPTFFGDPFPSAAHTNGPLLLAAVLSGMLGLYSLVLPHTPPTGKAGDPLPFLKAFALFKSFSFAVFFGVSFIITIVLAFYYTWTYVYLSNGLKLESVPTLMTIGQLAELILLPFLPFFLKSLRMKWVLALGMLCWGIRYALFAVGGGEGVPFALVILGIALHGICFDFFFAAGFIHVDNEAPKEIRASAQSLFGMLTYGAGMWIGGTFSGVLLDRIADPESKSLDLGTLWAAVSANFSDSADRPSVTPTLDQWHQFWLVPCLGVLASLLIFVIFFRNEKRNPVPATGSDDLTRAA